MKFIFTSLPPRHPALEVPPAPRGLFFFPKSLVNRRGGFVSFFLVQVPATSN